MTRAARIEALRRARPTDRLLRASVVVFLLLAAASWASGELQLGDLLRARRRENLARFLGTEIVPRPLRDGGEGSLLAWLGEHWTEYGAVALETTFWISVASIVLAALASVVPAFLGARSLNTEEPYARRSPRPGWSARLTRLACVLARAIPEYVWAFLLLAMLGASAWPAVLALALHNAGILGRLGADTIENVERRAPRALWLAGASRRGVAVFALGPSILGRMLAYFFYRWETCVREATVLGMLGVLSLGYFVGEMRSRQRYDELVFLVGLGALLVLAGDLVSLAARAWIRRGQSQTQEVRPEAAGPTL